MNLPSWRSRKSAAQAVSAWAVGQRGSFPVYFLRRFAVVFRFLLAAFLGFAFAFALAGAAFLFRFRVLMSRALPSAP